MKVLHLAHNHPDYHAGGTEIFAKALSEETNARRGWESRFIAAALPQYASGNPGTPFLADDRERGDIVVRGQGFERLNLSRLDAGGTLHQLGEFLAAEDPDIVHLHHFLLLGVETLTLVRRHAPRARIVVTLHDYYPICHRDGLMIRSFDDSLCDQASATRCARCFPDVGVTGFRLRELFIKNAFEQVDAFVAPSRFLLERYAAWGLDRARLHHVPNGYPRSASGGAAAGERREADPGCVTFGFFGHINGPKGVRVALAAARLLQKEGRREFHLRLHGSDAHAPEAIRSEVAAELAALDDLASDAGPYERAELPARMGEVDWVLVPSIWWENDPLVINEAFLNGRPVICSGIGGMAEKVRDGHNGLHARPNDPRSLAAAMRRALTEPGLAGQLAAGAPKVPSMADCGRAYRRLYKDLGAGRERAASAA